MKADMMAQRWNNVPVVCVGTPNQEGVDVVMEGVERHMLEVSSSMFQVSSSTLQVAGLMLEGLQVEGAA